ncbi:enoyl-CoA hydratase-related protein [Clostridioides sp. ES-S-0190-01]|uniref:enoyl-CoA hydratase-related protein n=1 Tax=Clostridioides sp. ES-S-0190-01 TaxID=2770787 RepID=UPI001D120900|nr:enoyl-CoA hydratase/isomerase family protein [Clostridioides sp. ES-S-0190-01]
MGFVMDNLKNLKVEVKDKVCVITINRPKALNALNNDTLRELSQVIDAVSEKDEILGVIITGEGKVFVAGADIRQMQNYKSEEGRKYAGYAQGIFDKIEALEKTVIAAVNGYALGGGCELAMSCDIRIASEKAIFGQPEVNLGVIPCFGGTQRLSRLVGIGIAKELIFTGRQVDAEEAKSIGLINKVVPSDLLLQESMNMMNQIVEKAPIAIRYAKVVINKGIDMDLKNALELEKDIAGLTFATRDKQEGMNAFIEKRKPIFENK